MTRGQFQSIVEIQRCFEFDYNGIHYLLTSEKNADGSYSIGLGRRDERPQFFSDITDLLAHAKIDNQYFREVLSEL